MEGLALPILYPVSPQTITLGCGLMRLTKSCAGGVICKQVSRPLFRPDEDQDLTNTHLFRHQGAECQATSYL